MSKNIEPTYSQDIFDVESISAAKNIILTPEKGTDSNQRWENETPYIVLKIGDLLELNENNIVLDFGCGIGRISKQIIEKYGCRVIGVDISASMRELAKKYVNNDKFKVYSTEEFQSKITNGFKIDHAFTSWVLQHCPDLKNDLLMIESALNEDSKIFILNNFFSCIPTENGWYNNGVNVWKLLSQQFRLITLEKLPSTVSSEEITDNSLIGLFQKTKNNNNLKQISDSLGNELFVTAQNYHQAGKIDLSIILYEILLLGDEVDSGITHYLGLAKYQVGEYQEGIELMLESIKCQPKNNDYRNNIAKAYSNLREFEEAKSHLIEAVNNNKNDIKQINDLGKLYLDIRQISKAKDCFKKVLSVDPDNSEAYYYLGDLYKIECKKGFSIASYKKAHELNPDNCSIINNLGVIFAEYGDHESANKYFLSALNKNPDDAKAHSNYLFNLNYQSETNPLTVFNLHKKFGQKYENVSRIFKFTNIENKKIRIGYISPDLYQHSVSYFIESIFNEHDHKRFEIIVYDDSHIHDQMSNRLREMSDVWREVAPLNDEQLAKIIYNDEIDILVDLAGHTSRHNRMHVFVMKPAPIQITYLGYPNTTGLTTIDYKITDKWADPPGETEKYYSEKLLRLDKGFLCYSPQESCPKIKESPFSRNGYVTFVSFNNFTKINIETMSYWAKILKETDMSRLILKAKQFSDATAMESIINYFEKQGIERNRLELITWFDSYQEHMGYYNNVDIALDTFPYNGTTTTCEALWMGVPIVTLAGKIHMSRVGVSILNQIGLDDYIAYSPEEYINIAINLAKDSEKLSKIRKGLRKRIKSSLLTDATGFVEELERTYESIHKEKNNNKNIKLLIEKANNQLSLGKNKEAIFIYEQILHVNENNAEAHHNIGLALSYLGCLEEAKQHIEQTLLMHPDNPAVYLNLGNIIKDMGCFNDAIIYFEKALELKHDYAEAENSLGLCWNGIGQQVKAVEHYNNAINLNPSLYQIYNNLGNALLGLVKVDEAINAFKTSIKLKPDFYMAQSNYLYALLYQKDIDPKQVYLEHVNWAKQFDCYKKCNYLNEVKKNRRIRIGYISPDFWRHPVIFFIEAIFSNHNRKKFEIYAYDDTRCPDEMTKRIESMVDKWRRVRGVDDEDVYKLIQNDNIDILVDLAGHTAENRLHLFSMKPVPIQISYLGYPHSTGLPMIDYRITDGVADPVNRTEKYHSEQLIRLPDCFLCYQVPENHPEISELPALKNGYVTFASFNNFIKVNTNILGIWADLLLALPNSRLIIKAKQLQDNNICQRVFTFFERKGISTERIELAAWFPTYAEHMDFYNKVDVGLDSFPYHGTTTTCEALYMGIPVVSLAGELHLSRVGTSILKQLGLDELIAETAEEYVNIAVKLANDLESLNAERNQLREKMNTSPITNAELFMSNMENEYIKTWNIWCDKNERKNNEKMNDIPRRLHIGGKIAHSDWEILDILPGVHVNHLGNANQLKQFSDETFYEIYASHVLEHFDFADGEINKVLNEWNRILQPGGKLYISVPDMDKLCDLFINSSLNVNQKFDIIRMIYGGHIDKHDYHQVGFNKDIIWAYLRDVGFKTIEITDDFGIFKDTSVLQYEGYPISLNLIATKPLKIKK